MINELQNHFEDQDKHRKIEFENIVSEIMEKKILDYHLFNNITNILDTYLDKKIFIRIWNFHLLDSKSTDFISFLYRNMKNNDISFKIIIYEKLMNDRIKYFIESFSGEQEFTLIKE
jgi:hypothetical protein